MPKRTDWTFDYPIGDIVQAVSKRIDWHKARRTHWIGKFNELATNLPTQLQITDIEEFVKANAGGGRAPSFSNSSYQSPTLIIDQMLQRRFEQAKYKVVEHNGKVVEYERWKAVLSDEKPDRSLALTMDDVEYFSIHAEALAQLATGDESDDE